MTNNSRPQILFSVRFKSSLPPSEVENRYKERLAEFQAIPGLVQKYYVRNAETDEWGGVYLWDSRESFDAFMASDLRKSIPDTYRFDGPPQIETIEIVDLLR